MAKDVWQWWKPGMTWTAAEQLGLLALADKEQDGTLPSDGAPLRMCNVFGAKAIGRAARVANGSVFCKVMAGYLPLTIIEPPDGRKRKVLATQIPQARYWGMMFRRARRIAYRARPRRKFYDVLDELVEALDQMAGTRQHGDPRAERAVLDKIEARYLER